MGVYNPTCRSNPLHLLFNILTLHPLCSSTIYLIAPHDINVSWPPDTYREIWKWRFEMVYSLDDAYGFREWLYESDITKAV